MAVNKIAQRAVKKKPSYSKKPSVSFTNKLRVQFEARDWTTFDESDDLALARLLNQANVDFEGDVFRDWFLAWTDAERPAEADAVRALSKGWFSAGMGVTALAATRGAVLTDHRRAWMDAKVDYLALNGRERIAEVEAEAAKSRPAPAPDPLRLALEEVEALLDGEEGSVYETLGKHRLTAAQVDALRARYQPLLDEARALQHDREVQEGFRHLPTVADRRAYLATVERLFADADSYLGGQRAAREARPRKAREKKAAAPDRVVAGLRFAPGDDALRVSSVAKAALAGAKAALVYHVRYGSLGLLEASAGGFSARGVTLTNVERARSRKLRKPEGVLQELVTASLARARVVFDSLTTTVYEASHRTSSDLVLLRVFR